MRIKAMLAVALVLAACSSSPDEDVDAVDEPQTQTSNHIPEDIYQPTVHAILALGGGYGPVRPAMRSRRFGAAPVRANRCASNCRQAR